jgi:acyl carrier protein
VDAADEIKGIIGKVLKIEPGALKAESRLSEMAADSLDLIEMVYMFEERFDISMELEARESSFAVKIKRNGQVQNVEFNTVGEIVDVVRQIVDAKVG